MTYSLALEVTLDFYRIGSKLLEEHANVCSLCLFRQAQKLMDKRQRQKKTYESISLITALCTPLYHVEILVLLDKLTKLWTITVQGSWLFFYCIIMIDATEFSTIQAKIQDFAETEKQSNSLFHWMQLSVSLRCKNKTKTNPTLVTFQQQFFPALTPGP